MPTEKPLEEGLKAAHFLLTALCTLKRFATRSLVLKEVAPDVLRYVFLAEGQASWESWQQRNLDRWPACLAELEAVEPEVTRARYDGDKVDYRCSATLALVTAAGHVSPYVDRKDFANFCEHLNNVLDGIDQVEFSHVQQEFMAAAELRTIRHTEVAADQPAVWYHGGTSYSRDGQSSACVSHEEHNFLQAFLDKSESLTTSKLEKAGVSNPSRVFSALVKMFGACPDGPARGPAKKGDGYFIHVKTRDVATE